jgi:integrase
MPRPRNSFPKPRLHRPTGAAVLDYRDPKTGARRTATLGPWGSQEAQDEYARWIALLRVNAPTAPGGRVASDLTVNAALVQYAKFVTAHYVDDAGKPTGTADDIKIALAYLRRLFGPTLLAEFGPGHLKAVRQAMIQDGRVRGQVNKRASQVRQFFRWCVEEETVKPAVLEGLRAVRPLTPGRSGAKEGQAVKPADPAAVAKAIPLMPPAVRAIVALLRLTGARPGELCRMRPGDVVRSGRVWTFTPRYHKTSWRGRTRTIHLGPDAQAVLAPWLGGVEPAELVFTPARSEAARIAERSAARKTPRYPSHMKRNAAKRKQPAATARKPAGRYNRHSLGLAIRRACRRAGVPHFSAYQLRHLKAVELRSRYGLEHVRAVLGHSFKAMSDHYSRAADDALAAQAASETG